MLPSLCAGRLNLAGLAGLVALAGCSQTPLTKDSGAAPAIKKIAADYQTYPLVTDKPVDVDPALAMLCRGARQSEVEAAQAVKGPHAHTRIIIHMNDLARTAFNRGSGDYPVGAVVVKQKTGLIYRDGKTDEFSRRTSDGVGGMVKRPPGYDSAHGDWEYFYFTEKSRIESGRIASCVQCHAGAKANDHVFGNWRRSSQ